MTFNYDSAFSRNIGWVTSDEQTRLKTTKIAIAGAGGVGGEHLITLTRMGFSQFHIADFDTFDVHNFNRQIGANMQTVALPKVDSIAEMAKSINPEASIELFKDGVTTDNLDAFFSDVDIYVDALDFFAMDAREMVFEYCLQHSIPVITAAPLGLGSALLCFTSESMNYRDYFDFRDTDSKQDKLIKFLIGLSPSLLQKEYLMVPEAADFIAEKGPSMCPSVKLCAGFAGTYALKLVLGRGKIMSAPHGLHFDAYLNTFKKTWCPFGNRGPIQRIKYQIAKRLVLK